MSKNSGYLVQTKDGLIGKKPRGKNINDKAPVYLMICEICGGEGEHVSDCTSTNFGFSKQSDRAILCNIDRLKIIGFID